MSELNNKIVNATKWSSTSEIVARLVTPITSIILARLLTPEAFGVVTTLTMIITFAEIFTDAGFQKYLIQHEFADDEDLDQSTNVAFWSNLIMSLLIWLLIGIFSEQLATLVGNPDLGYVITIASISIPLSSFSSIQTALYRRDLNFKPLFKIRLVSVIIPLFVTIPLAWYFRNFWALVIGTISVHIVNAILLTIYSRWRPKLFYSFGKFKEMFSFSSWSVVEAISIWLTNYIDIFIIGIYLNEYYLGLYKTSMTVVAQIMGIITAATTPVLYSSLSRLQSDDDAFRSLFFKFQKVVGLLVIPLGVGIFCYSDLITNILLGDQWLEASHFIGLWGLTTSITIVLSHYASEVYRAKGRPRLSVLSQVLHLLVLVPAILIAVKYGFTVLTVTRSLIRFEIIIVNIVIMYFIFHFSPLKMIKNIGAPLIASIVMAMSSYFLREVMQSILWQIISVVICVAIYFLIISLNTSYRDIVLSFLSKKKTDFLENM